MKTNATAKVAKGAKNKREGRNEMDAFDFHERAGSGVDEQTEALATNVIGALIEVHKIVRPGMPELAYRNAVCVELGLCHISFVPEFPVPIFYKGHQVAKGKIDILIAGRLVLELKAVEALTEIHRSQIITYLQATNLQLGLLVNFNVLRLRQGLKRVINTYNTLRG